MKPRKCDKCEQDTESVMCIERRPEEQETQEDTQVYLCRQCIWDMFENIHREIGPKYYKVTCLECSENQIRDWYPLELPKHETNPVSFRTCGRCRDRQRYGYH